MKLGHFEWLLTQSQQAGIKAQIGLCPGSESQTIQINRGSVILLLFPWARSLDWVASAVGMQAASLGSACPTQRAHGLLIMPLC